MGYCNGMSVEDKTMFGEYIVSENEQEKEIGTFDDNDDDALNDEIETDDMEHFSPKIDGHHLLIGTIVAISILFCGFLTMGYIAFIYFQHKKKQMEMTERAELLVEQAQQEIEDDNANVQL